MTPSGPGATAPTLIVTGGDLDGQVLRMEPGSERVLGANPDCHLQVPLANVDGVHARVSWGLHGLVLSDLGSTNGTYVNGERVQFDRALVDGDRVCLGPPGSRQSVKLLVRVPADAVLDQPGEDLGLVELGAEDLLLDADSPPAIDRNPSPVDDDLDALPIFALSDSEPVPVAQPEPTSPVGAASRPAPPEPTARAGPSPPLIELDLDSPVITSPPAPPVAPTPRAPAEAGRPTRAEPAAKPALRPPSSADTGALRRSKPEYTDELPSIAAPAAPEAVPASPAKGSTGRVSAVRPATARQAPTAGRRLAARLPAVPRPVLVGIATLLVALVAWGVYEWSSAPPPVLHAVMPSKAEPGGTVTIKGAGFSRDPVGNTVRFGTTPAQVISASSTSLAVTVPSIDLHAGPQNVAVFVENRAGRSARLFLRVVALPRVTALDPEVALPGMTVTLVGRNLDARPVQVTVGTRRADLVEARPDRIRIRVPDVPVTLGKSVPVQANVAGDVVSAPDLVLGRLPLLLEVSPNTGPLGQRVTLRGRGFATEPSGNVILFGGRRALVLKASPRELVAVAPAIRSSEVQAEVPVVVSVGAESSNVAEFVLTRPATGTFVPRFFAAEVAEHPGVTSVASELGPLLLLGDAGDAPTLGERAVRITEALNGAFDAAAAGSPLAFEARNTPAPAVWLVGGQQPLVSARAADASAYARVARAQAASSGALATFWAALLQDYATLFVQGQRPVRTAELSSRGRVLIDLFAEAQRRNRGGGTGVPRVLLAPLGTSLEANLRDLALGLADGGRTTVATRSQAIEGLWEGSADEIGTGSRAIQITLRTAGGQLRGSLATRSHGLSMAVPLADLSYERGTLRFTLATSGQPRVFTGSLQGSTITGSVTGVGGRPNLGTFKLDFVQ